MHLSIILQIILLTEGSAPGEVGPNGERSIYQISAIALREVNRDIYGRNVKFYSTLDDIEKSPKLAHLVALHYLLILRDKYHCNTVEKLVRGYNGGPLGYKKFATLDYWHRFNNFATDKGVDLIKINKYL